MKVVYVIPILVTVSHPVLLEASWNGTLKGRERSHAFRTTREAIVLIDDRQRLFLKIFYRHDMILTTIWVK